MSFTRGIALLDDCEGTCSWIGDGTGADWVVDNATAASWLGTKGLRLKSRTVGAAEGDTVEAVRMVGGVESGLLVWRGRWASPDLSAVKYLYFSVFDDDGTDYYLAHIQYDVSGGVVEYFDRSNQFVGMGIVPGVIGDGQWGMFEMVVDVAGDEWVSMRMFGQQGEIGGEALSVTEGGGTFRALRFRLYVVGAGAAPAEVYFDQIYIGEHIDL